MVYLFFSASDDNLNMAKVLITAFAGGCSTSHELTPVVIDWDNSVCTKEMLNAFENGRYIINNIHQVNENLGNVKIANCHVVNVTPYSSKSQMVGLIADHTPVMKYAMDLCYSLTQSFADAVIADNDRFIMVANMSDTAHEASIITAVAAMLAMRKCKAKITAIVISHHPDQTKCIYANVDYLQALADIVVIGDRQDYHKSGISLLQAANAVVDALSDNLSGKPEIPNISDMYYECDSLASDQMKNSMNNVRRIAQMYRAEQKGDLKEWKNRILVNAKNIWDYNDRTKAIMMLCALIDDWTAHVNFFRLFTNNDISSHIAACNKHSKLQMTSSNEQRYREVIVAFSELVSTQRSNAKFYGDLVVPADCDIYQDCSEGVSPVLWLKRSMDAFAEDHLKESDNMRAECRYACLDGWEVALGQMRGDLRVSEASISSLDDSIACAILSLSVDGQRLVNMGNPIVLDVDGTIWINEPAVGFACIKRNHITKAELIDRPVLCEFLFGYSMIFANVLDETFIKYVKKANEKHAEQLPKTIKGFFSNNPDLCKDIPIYY